MTEKEKIELRAKVKADRAEYDARIAYEIEMQKKDPNFEGKFDEDCGFDD